MSGFTGFNPDNVTQLSTKVATTSDEIAELIVSKIKTEIVDPMSQAWYSKEGVDFFKRFEEAVKGTGPHIQKIFAAYNDGVCEAGEHWRRRTDDTRSITKAIVDTPTMHCDTSCMQDQINGNAGIFEAGCEAVANKISGVRQDIFEQLKVAASSLKAESSFLGQNQASAVEELFIRIQDEVNRIFRFLEEDTNGPSLKSCIKKTVEDYQAAGQDVTRAFTQS